MTYNTKGQMTHEHAVSESPLVHDHKGVFGAQVADLPHNMTWFDGKRLYLFLPSMMTVSQEFDDAIGTGIALSEQLIYPTGIWSECSGLGYWKSYSKNSC